LKFYRTWPPSVKRLPDSCPIFAATAMIPYPLTQSGTCRSTHPDNFLLFFFRQKEASAYESHYWAVGRDGRSDRNGGSAAPRPELPFRQAVPDDIPRREFTSECLDWTKTGGIPGRVEAEELSDADRNGNGKNNDVCRNQLRYRA